MYNDWQKLIQVDTSYRADIIKGLLLENSIDAIVINKKDSSYQIGYFDIMVRNEDFLKATHIINNPSEFE